MDIFPVSKQSLRGLYVQLSMLVGAGVPLEDALETVAKRTGKKTLKRRLLSLIGAMRSGASLSEAASALPSLFPDCGAGILAVGESCGRVSESFTYLADDLTRRTENTRRLRKALGYPVLVLLLCVFVVLFILPVVSGAFSGIYADFGLELPGMTLAVLAAGKVFSAVIPFVVAFLVVLYVIYAVLRASVPGFAVAADRLKLYIPFYGGLIRDSETVRFARAVLWLSEAGCPSDRLFSIISQSFGNLYFKSRAELFPELVMKGADMAALIRGAGVFPSLFVEMTTVLSDRADIVSAISSCADVIEKSSEYKTETFLNTIGPVCIVAVAALILVALAALMLPMASLGDLL